MEQADCLLAVKGIGKSFGFHPVLREVSFDIRVNDFILLLGANGAGKSTLLRILAGLSTPGFGTIHKGRQCTLGFAGSGLQLYPRLTVGENLQFFLKIQGCHEGIDTYLSDWGLERFKNVAVSTLSKGNQWRVALARLLLGRPNLAILDEPTSNLDDKSVLTLLQKLDEIVNKDNGAIVLASHDIARIEDRVTRVISLDSGKLVSDTGSRAPRSVVIEHISMYRARNR